MLVPVAYADKKECGDATHYKKWLSEGHKDNKASKKLFNDMIEDNSLCENAKAVDHERADGEIDDWTDFKKTQAYKSALPDQKECLKKMFDSPDQDNGDKALQGYEIQDCAIDSSTEHGKGGY